MAKITKRAVDALEASEGRPIFLWDDALPGFGVKALPSGAKRYIVKYRVGGGRAAPQRWLMLGTHGHLTPDQARGLAQQALAAVARGDDPQEKKLDARVAETLNDVWKRFELEYLPLRKPQTRYEYENQWREAIAPRLGKVTVKMLSRNEVERFHKSLSRTPYRANRVLALLSRLMSLAEAWGLRPSGTNPCQYVERFKEKARNRYLSSAELERLGSAMRILVARTQVTPSAANAIRLLLLTGARLNEILSAKWAWIDWERSILELPDSKTGAKSIYLSIAALDVLARQRDATGTDEQIFPGSGREGRMINLKRPWAKVCAEAGLLDVRLHDLRHTAASIAVGQGATLPVIGRLLGHSQPQTTNRYAHVDADPALHAANAIGAAISDKIG